MGGLKNKNNKVKLSSIKTIKKRKTDLSVQLLKKRFVKAYTDPRSAASFTTPSNLLKQGQFVGLSKKEAYAALQHLDTYTRHKDTKRKFERNRVVVGTIDQQWQIDLMDMQNVQKQNKKYKYILTVIDVFSKYGWAIPSKSKTGHDISAAFKIVLASGRKPKYVQSDKGKEFLNKIFQTLLKDANITFFTTENDDIKAGIVERFNRTLKEKIWRYFTHANTYKYLDVLSDIVLSYNNTIHRSLNMAPIKVS